MDTCVATSQVYINAYAFRGFQGAFRGCRATLNPKPRKLLAEDPQHHRDGRGHAEGRLQDAELGGGIL